MKRVIASAGMFALGTIGVQIASADMIATTDKPWSISGTLRGFYDDNYNTQPSGPAKLASWGIEVRPRGDISYSDGPNTITASYIYDLRDFFSRPGNKLDQSHDFELFANHNFSERYSLDFEESFVDSQEPEVIDQSLSLPLRANGDNLRNSASVNFHAEVTPLLGFVLGYENTWYHYNGHNSTPTGFFSYATLLNRFEHLVTLNSRWHVMEQTVAILGYQFTAIDYTSGGPIGGGFTASSRNNYTHNVYVGIEHNFRSDFEIAGRVGFQASDYYNYNAPAGVPHPDTITPFVDFSANWTYNPDGVLTVGFRYSKNQTDVTGSGGAGQLTQDQESASVFATITQKLTPLSPNLTASATAEFQNSQFNGGLANNLDDKFYLLGLNLSYQFNHYLSGEVGYNFDELSSDLGGRSYQRNRIYVGVTATY